MQAYVYGIVVCGIRNLRVWFGPLPTSLCYLYGLLTNIIIFKFSFFMVFLISLTRFMFICVWKRMKQMNDDLIVRIAVISSTFLSICLSLTHWFIQKETRHHQLCSGDFSNRSMTMDWQEITKPKITMLDFPR